MTLAGRLPAPAPLATVRAACFGLMVSTGFAAGAAAQDATPAIEYRQNAMQLVAGHQNADLFPQGSGGSNARALDAIWEDPAGFAGAVAEFRAAAEGLLRAAEAGDREGVRAGLAALSAGCGTCHQPFRKPAPRPGGP